MRKKLILGGLLVVFAASCTSAWLMGSWVGGYRERHQRFLDEQNLIAPFLADDPAYAQVTIVESTGPGGGILMFGSVRTKVALERLKAELVRVFGEPRANQLISWANFKVQ